MKKLVVTLLAVALLLMGSALAATHDEYGVVFDYDDAVFEIAIDEHYSDEFLIILDAKDEALDNTFINISYETLEEGETFPTAEDLAELERINETKVERLDEWLGFKGVYTLAYDYSDEEMAWHAELFIAPVTDGDAVKGALYVYICADKIEDEEASMALSDAISAVLDGLKLNLDEMVAEGADSDWYMDILADKAMLEKYPYHAFVDINGNGVPVLIISTTADKFIGAEDKGIVYLYSEGAPKQVMEVGGGGGDVFYCNLDEHTLTHYSRVSGEEHIEVYRAVDGALEPVTTVDFYSPGHGPAEANGEAVYTQDGKAITEKEADVLRGDYATDNAITYEPMAGIDDAAPAETTYVHEELTFDYDGNHFTITMDDHTDDEDLVILTDKNEGYIRIHLRDLEDGEHFPTAEEIEASRGVKVEKIEAWGNFKNALYFELKNEDGTTESVFIAPVYDDDGEIDDILTVNIGGPTIKDEDAAVESADKISAVVDTLKVVDD